MSTVVTGWEAFFAAEVGASAALTGLVFVGISINLTKIMASPSLITRALQTMATLLSVLVVCSLLLVPGEAASALAVQVLFVGLAAWVTVVWLQIYQWRTLNPAFHRLFTVHILTAQLASLPFIVAGAVLWSRGAAGLYWIVPGVIFCLLDASYNAWVLLIEINR